MPNLIEELKAAGWKRIGTPNDPYFLTHPLLPEHRANLIAADEVTPYVDAATKLLRAAVKIIRQWHSMQIHLCSGLAIETKKQIEDEAWGLYYRNAPEMAPIRALLGPEGTADAEA